MNNIYVNDRGKSLITNKVPLNEGGNSLIFESGEKILKMFKPGEELNASLDKEEIQKIETISSIANRKYLLAPDSFIYQNNYLIAFLKLRSYGKRLFQLSRKISISSLSEGYLKFVECLKTIGDSGLLLDDLGGEILATKQKNLVLFQVADLESSTNFQSYNTTDINNLEFSRFLIEDLFITYYTERKRLLSQQYLYDGQLEAVDDILDFLYAFSLNLGLDFDDVDSLSSITFLDFLHKLKAELKTPKAKDFTNIEDIDQALFRI